MKNLCNFLFATCLTFKLAAQSPYSILERNISIRFSNTPVKEALSNTAQVGRFQFSYNARILDLDKKVSLFVNNLTVRETLFQMLGDNYNYQQKGEYLIIKKQNKPKLILSGYISDAKTGQKVKNATVYDAQTLRSTTTDENGFYTLKVEKRSTVVVEQLDYKKATLQITEGVSRFVKLDLDLKTEPKPIQKNPLGRAKTQLVAFFTSSLHELNSLNVQDSIHRRFQLSLLPFIGTNHAMSGSVINDFSLNATVGYSRGSRLAEFSGIGTFTKENAHGIQASGVFNIVKGNVKGLQSAGVFNHINDTLSGVQLGGVWNYVRTVHSGKAINQSAGIANVALNGQLMTQFAGISNVADSVLVQTAGIINQAKNVKGTQVAGIFNNAKTVKGVQISGIANRAKRIKGVQIGLINLADTLEGLQIGLISFAKNGGLNAIELSANELNLYNIAYKSGGRKIYTKLVAGITPQSDGNIWSYGAGLGTMIKLNKRSDFNIEAIHRHVNVGSYSDYMQEWIQLGLYWNIRLNNRFELTFGPTANGLYSNKNALISSENREKIFPSFVKRTIYTGTNVVWDTWLGGNLGLTIRLGK